MKRGLSPSVDFAEVIGSNTTGFTRRKVFSDCDAGTNPRTGKTADTRSAAQYFKDQQASTMTPNGKIKTDSVQHKDGEIHYKTEDGKLWRVRYPERSCTLYVWCQSS